ncbi:hypothetical protein G9A89_007782 [Geosiphon pyriformis]|nr:hypothetical protein G9A89_007782 [Geosiphon pyriformis]
MVKKTKSSEKWRQLLASAIVTPNPFVVPNEILDEISIASSGTSSKMGQDQSLAVLPNMVFSSRLLPVLEAKQSSPIGSPVFGNWANQMETDSSPSLIKLAHVKTVFQSVHGFLGAKSVLKDNVKLFCVEFASQQSLETAFLVELTGSVYLATLKIAKSLVVSESGSSSTAVALCDVSLGVSAIDIKLALNVFGSITHVVLKPAGIWQYVVVYFEKLDSAVSALKHWSVLVGKDSVKILPLMNQNETILSCNKFKAKLVNFLPGCTAFEISDMISQIVMFDSQSDLDSAVVKTGTLKKYHIWWKTSGCQHCFRCQEMGHLAMDCKISPPSSLKVPKVFKSRFVGSVSYTKTAALSGLSEFPSLVASSAASAADSAVTNSDLAVLVKSIVEPVGSLVALMSRLLNDNAIKTSAANNFANFMVGVSKNIACLRSEVDFGGMDYDSVLAGKLSFLSKDTIEHVIALWGNIESIKLFLSEFIFDFRNLNGFIKRIHELGLFSPTFDSA